MKDIKKEKVLIVDVECSCWMGKPPEGMRQEIIEIGISMLDVISNEVSEKRSFLIRPTDSTVGWFCKKLTSIDQKMLDTDGIELKDACEILKNEYDSKNIAWCSWGKFDKEQFEKDCQHKNVDYPFSSLFFNGQNMFQKISILDGPMSVKKGLEHMEAIFEGKQHRAVNDAYNTARLLSLALKKADKNFFNAFSTN